MTFTEAAAKVLRLVGKPLHYKEITDVAIEKDLLSHVGKSPEVTMGARLAALVKKGDKDNPLIRVKPGVFALQEWDEALIKKGLENRTPALKLLEKNGGNLEEEDAEVADASDDADPSDSEPVFSDEEEAEPSMGDDERRRAELAARAGDIFEAEDDDDEPILGMDDEDDALPAAEADGGSRGGRGRRRRRRRRGGEREEGDGLPTYTVSDAPAEGVVLDPAPAPRRREERGRDERGREERGRFQEERSRSSEDRGREPRHRSEDGTSESRRRHGGEEESSRRRGGAQEDAAPIAATLTEADELCEVLADLPRGGVSFKQLGDAALRAGIGGGEFKVQSLGIVMRADNAERMFSGLPARFRVNGQRVSLSESASDPELTRIQAKIKELTERHQGIVQRQLQKKLRDLPQRAATDLLMVLLNRLGYSDIQDVQRQGSHPAEVHLRAIAKTPAGEIATAIVLRRDGRDVGRERVIELRGALHHYGRAAVGLLVTTGQVLSGAREEASVDGATAVNFLDGASLAKACLDAGIGVVPGRVSLPTLDGELFESLRNNG